MTTNQYWYDNPQLLFNYEDVYLDNLKTKSIELDSLAHRISYYMRDVIEYTPTTPHGMVDGKAIKSLKEMAEKVLPKEPYSLINEKKKQEKNEHIKKAMERGLRPPTKEEIEKFKEEATKIDNKK